MTVKLECKHKEDGDARVEQTRNLLEEKDWKLSSFLGGGEAIVAGAIKQAQSFSRLDLISSCLGGEWMRSGDKGEVS